MSKVKREQKTQKYKKHNHETSISPSSSEFNSAQKRKVKRTITAWSAQYCEGIKKDASHSMVTADMKKAHGADEIMPLFDALAPSALVLDPVPGSDKADSWDDTRSRKPHLYGIPPGQTIVSKRSCGHAFLQCFGAACVVAVDVRKLAAGTSAQTSLLFPQWFLDLPTACAKDGIDALNG